MEFLRTTIDLPESLLRSAQRRAAELRVTLSDVVHEALRSYLDRNFQFPTIRGRLADPDLDLNRTSALFALDDEAEYGGPK